MSTVQGLLITKFVANSIKCLENYLDLANLTYFGAQTFQNRSQAQPRTQKNPLSSSRPSLTLPSRNELNDEEGNSALPASSEDSLQMMSRD